MLNCAVADAVPVIRLPDIPSLNGDDGVAFLGKIRESPWGDQTNIFDVVEYLDLFWKKGNGLLQEWVTRYVHAVSDRFIEHVPFRSDFSRHEVQKMIRDPREYFRVHDGREARCRAGEMLMNQGIPLQEDSLAVYMFSAVINLGCGDYRQACYSAEIAPLVMALPSGTSPEEAMRLLQHLEDAVFSVALYTTLSLQANIFAAILKERRGMI